MAYERARSVKNASRAPSRSGYASTVSQPIASNEGRAPSMTSATDGSTGSVSPQLGAHAMRSPPTPPSIASGEAPDIADHSNATSGTVRAIGPSVDSSSGSSSVRVGLNPTTLQKLAGLRSDPPRSL